MNDKESAEFYESPGGLQAGRRVTPNGRASMAGHVPVRFPQSSILEIKRIAIEDGVTVSTWIRRIVDREIALRTPAQTKNSVEFKFNLDEDFPVSTVTASGREVATA